MATTSFQTKQTKISHNHHITLIILAVLVALICITLFTTKKYLDRREYQQVVILQKQQNLNQAQQHKQSIETLVQNFKDFRDGAIVTHPNQSDVTNEVLILRALPTKYDALTFRLSLDNFLKEEQYIGNVEIPDSISLDTATADRTDLPAGVIPISDMIMTVTNLKLNEGGSSKCKTFEEFFADLDKLIRPMRITEITVDFKGSTSANAEDASDSCLSISLNLETYIKPKIPISITSEQSIPQNVPNP
ncbi:MAG: hypothetical protein OXF85_03010 [Candidatus Saccharibacteria bacterium]|nr:hypothetical protein [Candidatus Saccharibacteria bacterium]